MKTVPTIEVHDRKSICEHFDANPNKPITVLCPGSGSWCETFRSKEQYLKREDAWDRAMAGINSMEWYYLRGTVSYPWIND